MQIYLKRDPFYFYLCVCVPVFLWFAYTSKGVKRGPKRTLELQVSWATWVGCWDPNSSSLEGQQMLLTTEIPLQPFIVYSELNFYRIIIQPSFQLRHTVKPVTFILQCLSLFWTSLLTTLVSHRIGLKTCWGGNLMMLSHVTPVDCFPHRPATENTLCSPGCDYVSSQRQVALHQLRSPPDYKGHTQPTLAEQVNQFSTPVGQGTRKYFWHKWNAWPFFLIVLRMFAFYRVSDFSGLCLLLLIQVHLLITCLPKSWLIHSRWWCMLHTPHPALQWSQSRPWPGGSR